MQSPWFLWSFDPNASIKASHDTKRPSVSSREQTLTSLHTVWWNLILHYIELIMLPYHSRSDLAYDSFPESIVPLLPASGWLQFASDKHWWHSLCSIEKCWQVCFISQQTTYVCIHYSTQGQGWGLITLKLIFNEIFQNSIILLN